MSIGDLRCFQMSQDDFRQSQMFPKRSEVIPSLPRVSPDGSPQMPLLKFLLPDGFPQMPPHTSPPRCFPLDVPFR